MISIETENDYTVFKVTGEVTANDIVIKLSQFLNGDPTEKAIWDFTQTKKVKISTPEIRGIVESIAKFSNDEKARKVGLVGSGNVNIGLGKLFTAFAQMAKVPNHYKVFRQMDHAIQWLNQQTKVA